MEMIHTYLKNKLLVQAVIITIGIATLYACQSKNTNTTSQANVDTIRIDSIQTNNFSPKDSVLTDSSASVTYLFPSPDELLGEILSTQTEFDLKIINSNKNAVKYIETKQQALNLGVYLSDMAYINLNGDKTTALVYFKVIRDLAQKINVYKIFDEGIYNRIQNNIADKDSINEILESMYYDILDVLELTKRNNVYALVASGALIEALYISTMNVNDFTAYKPVATKVFEQKYVIDNFYEFASQYKNDTNVKDMLVLLDNLKTILDGNLTKKVNKKVIHNRKDNFTISGGEDIVVTEKSFNHFKESVLKIRQDIIKTN